MIRNMTIGNCTIDQNCIVHGTIFAERIVGDVAAIKSLYVRSNQAAHSACSLMCRSKFYQRVIVTGINIKAEGITLWRRRPTVRRHPLLYTAVFCMNGVEFGRESSVCDRRRQVKDFCHGKLTVTLPAGVRGRFSSFDTWRCVEYHSLVL